MAIFFQLYLECLLAITRTISRSENAFITKQKQTKLRQYAFLSNHFKINLIFYLLKVVGYVCESEIWPWLTPPAPSSTNCSKPSPETKYFFMSEWLVVVIYYPIFQYILLIIFTFLFVLHKKQNLHYSVIKAIAGLVIFPAIAMNITSYSREIFAHVNYLPQH